jgi:Uma2 family endonuclease
MTRAQSPFPAEWTFADLLHSLGNISPRRVRLRPLPGVAVEEDVIPDLAPNLAIEVLSEGNTPEEMQRKLKEYFFNGVELVWLVDLRRRTVEVYTAPDQCATLSEKDTLDGGKVLPGFALPVRQVFAKVGPTPPEAPDGAQEEVTASPAP